MVAIPQPKSRLVFQAVEDAIDLGNRQVLVIRLVDLHHRRGAARSQALRGAQRDAAVLGGLTRVTAQSLLAVAEDLLRAAEGAGQRAANPDLVFADGLLVEQRVERDHPLDVRGADLELA